MTKFDKLKLRIARLLSPKQVTPESHNSRYKLVIVDNSTNECTNHYFFSLKDAIKAASPPNIFLGDGKDYIIYRKDEDNKETYLVIYNSNKKLNYYGCNTI